MTDTVSPLRTGRDPGRDPGSRYHRQLVRGAWVNVVGLGARLAHPLFILVVTWMYGPAVMGVFFLGIFILDLVTAASVSGFADAVTILGSHHADGGEETSSELNETLGAALLWATGTALAMVALLEVGAAPLVETLYPDIPELADALRILGLAVPFMAWSQLAIAGTKVRMHMEYDAAVLGFLNPVLRLAFTAVAWRAGAGLSGFMVAIVAGEAVTTVLAGAAFARHFDVRATLAAALARPRAGAVARFALPQSLNMTFNRYLTRIDVLMLAAFGFGRAQLAFYATAVLITSNLRQVRLVFSSSLAPIAARHHHAEEMGELEAVLNRVSRWTTTLIVPIALALVVFRRDILGFVDEAYVGEDAFMAVLLLAPLVGCMLGLAGNCIIYTGHTGWTLTNSLLVAALNTAFNAVLIPRWGLMGAALGTAGAATAIALLQLAELWHLEGISLRWRSLWMPTTGLALAAAALALTWDPADLSTSARLAWGVGLPVGFVALMASLRHPEVLALGRRWIGRADG